MVQRSSNTAAIPIPKPYARDTFFADHMPLSKAVCYSLPKTVKRLWRPKAAGAGYRRLDE